MTRGERVEKLRYLITCMKCEVSGKMCDADCPTQYSAGNMGEIIENLEEIAKALEQEPTDKKFTKADIDAIVKAINKGWELRINEVLDKIRAEIKALSPEPTAYDVVDGNPIKDAVWETIADVLKIIDKYKGESEG